ncbi:MAG: ATP-binding cassette domain-containing protein [Clostridiales bacterium]|nr:ATP-binding cassette domain-containing protein [Clostridiales bacterium]
MDIIKVNDLEFKYPLMDNKVLDKININIKKGEFVLICGESGSGKSTLLKHFKAPLTPHGERKGNVLYNKVDIQDLDLRTASSDIGYVLQNPDNQIVTDKVWHELAFGLESLGYDNKTIRIRVAEMASYFGIQDWFYKNVSELSGGQKQLLNLASIMAMNPKVLVLDEPTSQLDPIAAAEFLDTVKKINEDLGVTIIITEHRLEEVFKMAHKVIVMEKGKIIANDLPRKICSELKDNNMFIALPTPVKLYMSFNNNLECPITVNEGRQWLNNFFKDRNINVNSIKKEYNVNEEIIIEAKNVWFKYEKNGKDIIKDFNLKVHKGEIYSIVGGNGTGKTTALSLLSTINKPYRGKIYLNNKELKKYSDKIALLPQNPETLFVKKTVKLDLMEVLADANLNEKEIEEKINEIAKLTDISHLFSMHPYDLSGGEKQKVALAKVLLLKPSILLLDEPTKGLDNFYKYKLSSIIKNLKEKGVTIIMVTHDVEFAAMVSDTCGMFFDGNIITYNTPEKFFGNNNFYTTSANKISREIFNNAVTIEELITLCNMNI